MSDAFVDLSACKDRATRVVELVTEIERLKAELKTFDIIYGGESQLSFFIRRAKEMEEKADRLRVENQKLRESKKVFMDAARAAEIEIEVLKAELSAAPHWVPAEEYVKSAKELHKQLVGTFGNGDMFTCHLSSDRHDNPCWESDSIALNATVAHVLVGLRRPSSQIAMRPTLGESPVAAKSKLAKPVGCMHQNVRVVLGTPYDSFSRVCADCGNDV